MVSTARTAETIFVGDAQSLIRAAKEAEAAVAKAAEGMATANAKIGASASAAAVKTEAAHAKMVASAKHSNEAFAKWGTVAAAAVVGGAVDMALKVETAAAAIAKASGASAAGAKKIEDAFRTLPGTVEFSAAKIGSAYATIAGELKVVEGHTLTAAQAMKVMRAALDLTDATGGDLTKTTEALGKVMLTYGLKANEAAKATDILFNASKLTGVSIEEVASTVDRMRGRLGVLAPSLGETAALMAELQKSGVAGRQSLSALNGVFSTLESGTKKVTQTLDKLGVNIFDHQHKFIGLKGVIEQLAPALSKYDQQSQLAITRTLLGAGANRQLLAIIHQGPAAYEAWIKAVEKQNAATRAADAEHKTLQGKLKATKADLENMGATIGERLLPIMQSLASALDNSIKWLDKHKAAAKALAVAISAILGAAVLDFAVVKAVKFVGSLKLMADGLKALAVKMGITAGVVKTADAEIATANETAAGSFSAMLGPIALVAAAAVALKGPFEALEKTAFFQNTFGGGVGANPNAAFNSPAARKFMEEQAIGSGAGQENRGAASNRRGTRSEPINILTGGGLSAFAAAGILGNAAQEGSPSDTGPSGLGMFQYMGGRRSGLEAFARSRHEPITSETAQLLWTLKELHGPERGTLAAINAAKSPQQAARIFAERFERPAPATANYAHRERAAGEAYGSQHWTEPTTAHHHKAHKEKTVHLTEAFDKATGQIEKHTAAGWAHIHALEAQRKALEAPGLKTAKLEGLTEKVVAAHEKALRVLQTAATAKWQETLASFRISSENAFTSMKDVLGKAVGAWAKAAEAAIKSSPASKAVTAKRKEDEEEETRKTEEGLTKGLKEAKQTGDKTKIKEAEEAITRFKRDQDIKREEATVKTEEEALGERVTNYEHMLEAQFNALTKQLEKAEISYAVYGAKVNAILASAGIAAIDLPTGPSGGVVPHEYTTPGGFVRVGPGIPKRAAGGMVYPGVSYMVGERGPEMFTPSSSGSISPNGQPVAAGISNHFSGPVTMGSQRDVQKFADRLSFRLRHG